MARSQNVYFFQSGLSGPIKIGVTVNVTMRLRVIKTDHWSDVVCLGTIECVGTDGFKAEADLHKRFSFCRIKGEWFHPDPLLLSHIKKHSIKYAEERKGDRPRRAPTWRGGMISKRNEIRK